MSKSPAKFPPKEGEVEFSYQLVTSPTDRNHGRSLVSQTMEQCASTRKSGQPSHLVAVANHVHVFQEGYVTLRLGSGRFYLTRSDIVIDFADPNSSAVHSSQAGASSATLLLPLISVQALDLLEPSSGLHGLVAATSHRSSSESTSISAPRSVVSALRCGYRVLVARLCNRMLTIAFPSSTSADVVDRIRQLGDKPADYIALSAMRPHAASFYRMSNLSRTIPFYTMSNATTLSSIILPTGDSKAVDPLARAFASHPRLDHVVSEKQSWFLYDVEKEWRRLLSKLESPDRARLFRIVAINHICPTYPSHIIVPSILSDQQILEEAQHRTKQRLPALSYLHGPSGNSLFRSAQPKMISEDWLRSFFVNDTEPKPFIKGIQNTTPGGWLKVFDLRPPQNAYANALVGGGFERKQDRVDLSFAYIHNVSAVRQAFDDLCALCAAPGKILIGGNSPTTPTVPSQRISETRDNIEFSSAFVKTKWPEFLRRILGISMAVAKALLAHPSEEETERPTREQLQHEAGSSVLIHCTDGWDRTAQVAVLTQLLLDPYYRTVQGFCVLIQKEFVGFGHQFKTRSLAPLTTPKTSCGDVEDQTKTPNNGSCTPPSEDALSSWEMSGGEESHCEKPFHLGSGGTGPIFLQLMDCVSQLLKMSPSSFEFTEELLIFLLDAKESGFYADFSCDSMSELLASRLTSHTPSVLREVVNAITLVASWSQHPNEGTSNQRRVLALLKASTDSFLNPTFDATSTIRLRFDLECHDIVFWRKYFCRFSDALIPPLESPSPIHALSPNTSSAGGFPNTRSTSQESLDSEVLLHKHSSPVTTTPPSFASTPSKQYPSQNKPRNTFAFSHRCRALAKPTSTLSLDGVEEASPPSKLGSTDLASPNSPQRFRVFPNTPTTQFKACSIAHPKPHTAQPVARQRTVSSVHMSAFDEDM